MKPIPDALTVLNIFALINRDDNPSTTSRSNREIYINVINVELLLETCLILVVDIIFNNAIFLYDAFKLVKSSEQDISTR